MKVFNTQFDHGMPLFNDDFRFMQEINSDAFKAVLSGLSEVDPIFIISGCIRTVVGSTVEVSEGWVMKNGEILRFAGQSYPLPSSPDKEYWELETVAISGSPAIRVFKDSAPNQVWEERVVKVSIGTSVPSESKEIGLTKRFFELIDEQMQWNSRLTSFFNSNFNTYFGDEFDKYHLSKDISTASEFSSVLSADINTGKYVISSKHKTYLNILNLATSNPVPPAFEVTGVLNSTTNGAEIYFAIHYFTSPQSASLAIRANSSNLPAGSLPILIEGNNTADFLIDSAPSSPSEVKLLKFIKHYDGLYLLNP